MVSLGKKENKAGKVTPPKQPKQKPPRQSSPTAVPDIYTLLLGLSALFLIISAIVLGMNWMWYQSNGVLPLSSLPG